MRWMAHSLICMVDGLRIRMLGWQVSTWEVVCSGFFDSIGLYAEPNAAQVEVTKRWIESNLRLIASLIMIASFIRWRSVGSSAFN